jgi:MIP family channel proteins
MDTSLRPYVAELVGTFAVVFVSAGAVCAAYLPIGVPLDVTGLALAYGLVVAVALSCTINVSGGYLNPAITIALWVLRRIEHRQAAWLLAAQLLGSALAGGALRLIFREDVLVFGTPHLTGAFGELTFQSMLTGAGIEAVLTFLLTFAVFGTVIDRRTPRLSGLGVGLTLGLALAALALVGFRLTGAAANPARGFGPFLWELTYRHGDFREHLLVYWLGPVLGAVLAGMVYTYLILPPEPEKAAAATATPAAAKAKK